MNSSNMLPEQLCCRSDMVALLTLPIIEDLMFFRHVLVVELLIESIVPATPAFECFGVLVDLQDVFFHCESLRR